jgi:hypothetical protein
VGGGSVGEQGARGEGRIRGYGYGIWDLLDLDLGLSCLGLSLSGECCLSGRGFELFGFEFEFEL